MISCSSHLPRRERQGDSLTRRVLDTRFVKRGAGFDVGEGCADSISKLIDHANGTQRLENAYGRQEQLNLLRVRLQTRPAVFPQDANGTDQQEASEIDPFSVGGPVCRRDRAFEPEIEKKKRSRAKILVDVLSNEVSEVW